ncbi:MAG: ferritin [Anaerolineae bacterium]
MINKTVEAAINEQIKHEFYSAYLYLSMSAWAEANNLPGAAHWLRAQAQEEQGHAMKFYDYVNEQGGRVVLGPIAQPPAEWTSLLDLYQQVLDHEKKVTALITKLYETALAEKDYATQILLQWFINEQVEEEKNATQIIEAIKMVGNSGTALYMIDRQLAARS